METLLNEPFYSVLFIGLGLVLVLLEVFIPSGGILLAVAVGVLGFGTYSLFHQERFVLGISSIVLSVVFSGSMALFFLRRTRLSSIQDLQTFTSVDETIALVAGKSGVALTPLRPAGVARIDGRRVDVVATGGFIEKDRPVRVIDTSGNRVVVREVTQLQEGT